MGITLKRIVWELEDGRKKYSMNTKGVESYNDVELIMMEEAMKDVGFGYTKDLELFGVSAFLEEHVPDFVKITGMSTEEADLPLTEGVILR